MRAARIAPAAVLALVLAALLEYPQARPWK